MRINSKGQVTIPADIRARAGLVPNTEVTIAYDGTSDRLVPAPRTPTSDATLVAHLRGRGDVPMTTDAIMALTRGE
ncbi:MAG: AbrB/MazE/SpoVT family DNA-binding domain-containing protein [Alphaproteobacteria bacterium]|nr:AbrB/MazE/SpoVT family DNA-binding domain-containing protein [Alphaproteobacteria bacterium]